MVLGKKGFSMRFSELKPKEVINTSSCKSMGCVVDIEFNPCTGQITDLIVPGPGKFSCFLSRESEYWIPWECICQIGQDIILVNIHEENCLKKL